MRWSCWLFPHGGMCSDSRQKGLTNLGGITRTWLRTLSRETWTWEWTNRISAIETSFSCSVDLFFSFFSAHQKCNTMTWNSCWEENTIVLLTHWFPPKERSSQIETQECRGVTKVYLRQTQHTNTRLWFVHTEKSSNRYWNLTQNRHRFPTRNP